MATSKIVAMEETQWKPLDLDAKGLTPFARRVREALNHAKLTITDAAVQLTEMENRKVKHQTVQYIAQKAKSSSLDLSLAALCGVNLNWLKRGTGHMLDTPATHLPLSESSPPVGFGAQSQANHAIIEAAKAAWNKLLQEQSARTVMLAKIILAVTSSD